MPLYRAHVLDENGQVVAVVDFECADDDEARRRVEQLRGHQAELYRKIPLQPSSAKARVN